MLALVLLVGGLGITFGTHYCMGIPVKHAWMLGHEDLSCGMASMENQETPGDGTYFMRDCCDDEFHSLEQAELFKTTVKVELPTGFVHPVELYSLDVVVVAKTSEGTFASYHPPPPDVDFTIAHQVFRI